MSDNKQGAQECPRYCKEHDISYTSRLLPGGVWSICPACEHGPTSSTPKRGGPAQKIGETLPPKLKTRPATCDKHGEFKSINYLGNVWSRCPTCAEIDAKERKAKEQAEERAARVHRWREALGHSHIPERFMDRNLDNYQATNQGQKRVLAFAREYAANFDKALRTGRCALFCGSPGTGKNHISIGIAHEVMKGERHTAYFTTVLRAVRRVKETWTRGSKETETQAIAALVFPDLLILDEVGVQFGSEAEKTILFDVLNERYEKRKPTLFLSNLEPEGVKAFLGERVFSRLREDGGQFFPFDWEDYRAKAADERPKPDLEQ